jgi:hypothetical protein
MTQLTKVENFESHFPTVRQDPNEALRMECGRLIHAAVISRRFLDGLLINPLQSIENGYCGEKFAFTREEKQRIRHIRATNLADFSSQLMLAVELPTNVSSVPEMAYVQ